MKMLFEPSNKLTWSAPEDLNCKLTRTVDVCEPFHISENSMKKLETIELQMNMEKVLSEINDSYTSVNPSSMLQLCDNDELQKTEQYNPADFRDKATGTSDFAAFIHYFKSCLGTGLLVMPGAFKNAGLIFGVFGTLIVGIIFTHCVHLLVSSSQKLAIKFKQPSLNFYTTAELAFQTGPKIFQPFAGPAREVIMWLSLSGICLVISIYIVTVAKIIQQVVSNIFDFNMDYRIYIAASLFVLIPLGIIRSMKILAKFSVLASVFMISSLIIIAFYTSQNLPHINERKFVTSPENWPLFFPKVLFAMEGISTVLPIENSMLKPQHFLRCPGVLYPAMVLIVVLYEVLGFVGYLKYGDLAEGSIILNLGQNWPEEFAKVLVALSILSSFGLYFAVPSDIVWSKIQNKISEKHHTKGYYIMRGLLILLICFIACAIPKLGPVISLVGAFTSSILALFFPAIIDICTNYEEGYGWNNWKLHKNIFFILLAVLCLITGSYTSVVEIIKSYRME